LRAVLGHEDPARAVPVGIRSRRMDEAELRATFASAAASPLWEATMQVLLAQYDNVTSQVSNPRTATEPGALAHCAGGMEWLGQSIVELQQWAHAEPAVGSALPKVD